MNKARTIRWFEISGMTILLILLVTFVSFTAVAAQPSPDRPSGSEGSTGTSDSSRLLERAQQEGSIRAIVGLRTDFVPEGRLSRPQAVDQQNGIESAGAGLQADLAGTGYRTLREYETVPYIALKLTPEAFRAVQRSPRATTIQEDVSVPADLAESTSIVQSPTMWANNFTGAGRTIAILDTGVDSGHPFLAGKVVEEACFSGNSNCPNGQTTQTGAGSGAPCTYAASGCRHGTHVAGIAAGQGSNFSGVARGANIMSVQVFSRFTGASCNDAGEDPCTRTFTSDQIAGLDYVFQRRFAHTFSAANMSLGGGQFTSNCDTDSRKAAIDNLRSISVATVISSGNDGFTNAVGAPGCISSAITVGSTTKTDTLSSFSNSSSSVDLLAPGSSINSSVPGGGFAFFNGTSMAAPHVSGAWAILEQWDAGQDVGSITSRLQNTGTPVTDNRPGGTVTARRINIADAASVRPPNDGFGFPQSLSGATVSLNGINGAATRESGEPDHLPAGGSLGENSVWYSWTAPASGPVNMDTCTSSFDTVLAVYTGGSTFPSLTQVASDDDTCSSPNDAGSQLTFNAVEGTTYRIPVSGYFASSEGTFTLQVIDKKPPKVSGTSPDNGVKGVARGANVKATFSEAMQASTTINNFKLKRQGASRNVGATVSYASATKTATLNPISNLVAGATYTATVTTGAKDLAGNSLDQNSSHSGNQPKTWTFKVAQ